MGRFDVSTAPAYISMVLPDNTAATNRANACAAAEEILQQKRSNTPIFRVVASIGFSAARGS
jgi:hypothetical protein